MQNQEKTPINDALKLVSDFIMKYKITDEDLQQDMYLYAITMAKKGLKYRSIYANLYRLINNDKITNADDEIKVISYGLDNIYTEGNDEIDRIVMLNALHSSIHNLLNELTDIEKYIIKIRYQGNLSLEESSNAFLNKYGYHISRQRVYAIQKHAIRKLRKPKNFRFLVDFLECDFEKSNIYIIIDENNK